MINKTIVVWFSCGAASAVAAKETLEKYGKDNIVRIVNNPIANEDSDNQRFLKDVEKWLGVTIETAVNPKFESNDCNEVWKKRRFMSSPYGAPCTLELKKAARQLWEANNPHDYMVLGFTAEEKQRHENFIKSERENCLPILIEAGITKQKCFEAIQNAGIELPRIYKLGYPNANCVACVKATSPTYWNHVRKMHPHIFEERAKLSRELGARLVRVKGKRLFLDELDPKAAGRPMKSLKVIDCGIFCEEK